MRQLRDKPDEQPQALFRQQRVRRRLFGCRPQHGRSHREPLEAAEAIQHDAERVLWPQQREPELHSCKVQVAKVRALRACLVVEHLLGHRAAVAAPHLGAHLRRHGQDAQRRVKQLQPHRHRHELEQRRDVDALHRREASAQHAHEAVQRNVERHERAAAVKLGAHERRKRAVVHLAQRPVRAVAVAGAPQRSLDGLAALRDDVAPAGHDAGAAGSRG
mmetsp:Transcript_3938/g.14640  ORF Transcript_3938/g.14640 Transcript_3938/m.14640 type:complete len:218 (-) Transcript_3938:2337-2990(-)